MKQLKEHLYSHTVNLAPKIAFIAIFGITGVLLIAATKAYSSLKNINTEPLDLTGYENTHQQ